MSGDAEWGDGYGFFPCLLIELEEHIFTILPLAPDLHPDVLVGAAKAQADANDLPVRLCSGSAGLNYRTRRPGDELRIWLRMDIVIPSALRLASNVLCGTPEQDDE